MAADGGTTALALAAFFGLCVPGVSSGRIEQTYSTESLRHLTDSERRDLADAIDGTDTAFRVKSDEHLILVTTKGGACHVITAVGDTQDAKAAFIRALEAAGGMQEATGVEKRPGWLEVSGTIWTNPPHDRVVVGFTAEESGDKGFYAFAFGTHKD